nr:syntaxin of plants 52 [Tanacetum cinerariifolium]
MASYVDPWVREYNEACKLSDDISSMISARGSYGSGPEGQRHSSAIRRKITILGTRLDSLQTLLSKLPAQQPVLDIIELQQERVTTPVPKKHFLRCNNSIIDAKIIYNLVF